MRRSHGGAEGRPGENLQCENDQMIKTPQTFLKSKNTFRSFQTNLKANIWWDPPNLFVKLIEILNALLHTFSYHFLGQHQHAAAPLFSCHVPPQLVHCAAKIKLQKSQEKVDLWSPIG